MRLNQNQMDSVFAWLEKHKISKCSTCGDVEVTVDNNIFELPEHNTPALISKQVFPIIPICCRSCGQVFLLSALTTGVVRPKARPGSDDC